jgi:primosomal protein N' (replication factor Y) (superfamily II helicase)
MSKEEGIFGKVLQEEMTKTLANGKQVILFLNRRGYSYYFHCKSCGFELKCPHCDVAMTYHRRLGTLQCHYCGYSQKPIKVCPQCGSLDVMYSGFGTEQVEQEIERLFPQYKAARLDTDTVAKDRKIIQKTLDEFREGKINILIGTQMVAKGLNFPNVQLVGIVLADSGLLIPDFRAEERTFDLLVQVAGRSGRADTSGRVVVQTRMKDNPAIVMASKGQVEQFFNKEIELRKTLGFPPFSRMVNLVIRSPKAELARDFADALATKLRSVAKNTQIYGANECPIEKIRANYRYQVLLKSTKPADMLHCLDLALTGLKTPSGVVLEIDIDPVDLL